MKTKVSNIISSNGNATPNQFEITTDKGTFFQSYETIIVFIPKDVDNWPNEETPRKRKIKLDRSSWNCSVTTGKYRNIFLGEKRKETEQKIKDGIYILADLN